MMNYSIEDAINMFESIIDEFEALYFDKEKEVA